MAYYVDRINDCYLVVRTEGGRQITFTIQEGQKVPKEFQLGDKLAIINHPDHPSITAMGLENSGFYEITHLTSGKILRTMHAADEWQVETDPS